MSYNTVRLHQRNDPEFAAQVQEAEEYRAQLLHDACWKEAVEGRLEPVYFQGQIVAHVRKYDTLIRIEMLRAHLPDKFKTPGSTNVTMNTPNSTYVLTEERRQQLIEKRSRALEAMPGPVQATPALRHE